MFRKISSAAAEAHSFASPFTRPPKPAPLNSRNSTSLLQMFRKISSAAADADADADAFSYLFTLPPEPTPLKSRKWRSRFTIPAETTSFWLYELKIGVSTARLKKFLQTNCKSGYVSADEALRLFHSMVQMEPRFRLYSFNLLLKGLDENRGYYDVLSLYSQMNSVGLTPNFVTLNILLNCYCKANRVREAFMVMGRILRKGYSPNIPTAFQLFLRSENFGCPPDATSFSILGIGLCRSRKSSNALKLHEEIWLVRMINMAQVAN